MKIIYTGTAVLYLKTRRSSAIIEESKFENTRILYEIQSPDKDFFSKMMRISVTVKFL